MIRRVFAVFYNYAQDGMDVHELIAICGNRDRADQVIESALTQVTGDRKQFEVEEFLLQE